MMMREKLTSITVTTLPTKHASVKLPVRPIDAQKMHGADIGRRVFDAHKKSLLVSGLLDHD